MSTTTETPQRPPKLHFIPFKKELVERCYDGSKTVSSRIFKKDGRFQVGDIIAIKETWQPSIWTQSEVLEVRFDAVTPQGNTRHSIHNCIYLNTADFEPNHELEKNFCRKIDRLVKDRFNGERKCSRLYTVPSMGDKPRTASSNEVGKRLPWRPGRFLPLGAVRGFLVVTKTGRRKVQDLLLEDMKREGYIGKCDIDMATDWWKKLWDSMYGDTDFEYAHNPMTDYFQFGVVSYKGLNNKWLKGYFQKQMLTTNHYE